MNKTRISVEEQLNRLIKMGIAPKHDDFIDYICDICGKEEVETDPYNLILYELGGERENGDVWESLSDDMYTFDTECVEDDDIYEIILERLSALSKGIFSIGNTHSAVDHDNQSASVSFTYNGTDYQWELRYKDDWFDYDVINKINGLIENNRLSKFFYTSYLAQALCVIFTSEDTVRELNRLVRVPFVLGVSYDG